MGIYHWPNWGSSYSIVITNVRECSIVESTIFMELKPTCHHLNHMCLVKPTFLCFITVSDGQITMCKLVNPPNCSVFYPRLFWLTSLWFPKKTRSENLRLRDLGEVELMLFWLGLMSYPLVNIQKTMENHHFSWEHSLFLWQFSIAMLVYQRVIGGSWIYGTTGYWYLIGYTNYGTLYGLYQLLLTPS